MNKQEQDKLRLDLRQFIGTERYYKFNILTPNIVLTDGSKYLAETAQCYWLMDLIASYQYKLKQQEFQTWMLSKRKDDVWYAECYSDYEKGDEEFNKENRLVVQTIPYSDFPLDDGIKLYYQRGVIFLPSEY